MTCTVTVEFRHSLGDEVRILKLSRPATVTGLAVFGATKQYRVVWWNEGERKEEWLYAEELEAQ